MSNIFTPRRFAKRVFIPPSSGPAVSAISAISAPPPPSPRHVRRPCNVNLHNTATRADSTIDDRLLHWPHLLTLISTTRLCIYPVFWFCVFSLRVLVFGHGTCKLRGARCSTCLWAMDGCMQLDLLAPAFPSSLNVYNTSK